MFSLQDDRLVLDTLFVETDDPQPIDGATPYLGQPNEVKQAAKELPNLSGGQPIFTDIKQLRVRFSRDILGVFVNGFSTIYTKLGYVLPFTGKFLLRNEVNPLEWTLYSLRRGFIDGDNNCRNMYSDRDPMTILYESMMEQSVQQDAIQQLFDNHDKISIELLDAAADLLDSYSILLEFKDGVLMNQSELNIKEMREILLNMRVLFFIEYM